MKTYAVCLLLINKSSRQRIKDNANYMSLNFVGEFYMWLLKVTMYKTKNTLMGTK